MSVWWILPAMPTLLALWLLYDEDEWHISAAFLVGLWLYTLSVRYLP